MAITGLLAAYALLTYGSPDSLLRRLFPDPSSDWYVAVACSFIFFALGFLPFQSGQDKGFRELVELNAENIREHRQRGKSDEDIATSIMAAMNTRPGIKYKMSHKKLVYYLSQFR
jgi:serine/threonine protein kinase